MNRQAAVALLSLLPFAVSSVFAFGAWEATEALATVWQLIVMVLVWVGVFAACTQVFWKVVGALATQP